MITRVQLTNWKAYDHLDLRLDAGTTFLVAANGVGKSSFLEAVRWALDPSATPYDTAMRRLASTTTVTIDLLVDHRHVVISRTMDRGTGSTPQLRTAATVDGDDTPVDAALDLFASSWKADPAFLHRSAFLTDRLLLEEGEPDLEEHLVRLYSLDALRKAHTSASSAAAQLETGAKAAKKESKATADQLAAATAHLSELETEASSANEEAASLTAAAKAAALAVSHANDAIAARERHERWTTDRAALLVDIGDLLGEPPTGTTLEEFLDNAAAGARAQLTRDTQQRAALAERIASIEASLARLHSTEGECPLCRQPLDANGRHHAEAAHQADLDLASEQLESLDPTETSSVTTDIEQLRRRLHTLGTLPNPPDEPDPGLSTLSATEDAARAAASAASSTAEQARIDAGVARARLADLERSTTAPDAVRLFEQAALLTASAAALDNGIAQVLERQIGPLSDQVNRRWEALFPDRAGLSLDRSGKLARVYDDDGDPLPFEAFSSGEKVVAKILMRLTTLSATTNIPFIWIDEPLEHLDPTSRVFVAETLALLTSTTGITQIVVTTYEDELARRLEAQDDHPVQLRVLRTERTSTNLRFSRTDADAPT